MTARRSKGARATQTPSPAPPSSPPPLERRGREILADVAGYLAAGGTDDVLSRVAGALQRGLEGSCRIWVRTPDGFSFQPVVPDGAEEPGPEALTEATARVREGESAELTDRVWHVWEPLVFDGESLGILEATVPEGPEAEGLRRVIRIVANVLAPQIASIELSEDLASEVALRTREIDEQRRFTSKIIDSLPVGLYVVDRDYRIQAWNRKRETGTQGMVRDEVLGRTVFEVLRRQPRSLLKREFDRVFSTGRMEQMEVESDAVGDPRHYRITKIPMRLNDEEVTHVITIGEDITDWREVQLQVAQTEKMAAVGQLAAGVMHEINNPLATIGACVEALVVRTGDLEPEHRQAVEEYLHIVESELERCKSIVDGLLDFSRPKARVKRPADVNQVVDDAIFLVRHHHKFKRIELVRDFADGLPQINANVEQLIQVFLALMLNAIDAMEGKGILKVRTLANPDRPGEVFVEVHDTGTGIAREDIPKIFEPFYTTKVMSRGTGLGLSICYGIVQQHDGRIVVESQLGWGSIFRVVLPVLGAQETKA